MFNDRIRSARMQRGFTLQYVSDCLNIPLRTYQRYEQGYTQPSLQTLAKLADILDVSTDWILERDIWLDSHGVIVDVAPSNPPRRPKAK